MKKEWKWYLLHAFGATAGGILSIVIGFILDEKGMAWAFPVFLVLAVVCLAIELVMLIKVGHRLDEKIADQYTRLTATTLHELDQVSVQKIFQDQGYHFLDGEILMKTTLWRLGTVSCYVRWISARCDTEEELTDTLTSSLDGVITWEQHNKKLEQSHSCLFLFLELEELNDVVMANIPAVEMKLMQGSFARPFCKEKVKTLIVVPVDKTSGQGHFWSQPVGPNVYAHGCRLLKKYFS